MMSVVSVKVGKAALLARCAVVLTIGLGVGPVQAATAPSPYVFGPEPEWETYRATAETAINARLIDPESSRITWTRGYHKGGFKPFLQGRVSGYVACGLVNAKNRMGGYAGTTAFVVVIDYGRVIYAEIDSRPGGMIDEQCSRAKTDGLFPPLPAAVVAAGDAASPSKPGSASGLTLRAMPDGAYVTAVADNSAAGRRDMKPGMVIVSVNGIPLAGMGEAMIKVVEAASPSATLTMVGGATIKLDGQ